MRDYHKEAQEDIAYWHRVCRAYDEGRASGPDIKFALKDALRSLERAEAHGVDVLALRSSSALRGKAADL